MLLCLCICDGEDVGGEDCDGEGDNDDVDGEDGEDGEDGDGDGCKWLDFAPKWFHVGAETDSEWCQASCWSPPPFVLSPHLFQWKSPNLALCKDKPGEGGLTKNFFRLYFLDNSLNIQSH